jgi:hypothetical protein
MRIVLCSLLHSFDILDGKLQVHSDGSVELEGQLAVLNALHSFLVHKSSNRHTMEFLYLRSEQIVMKVMPGKLIDQSVEGVL